MERKKSLYINLQIFTICSLFAHADMFNSVVFFLLRGPLFRKPRRERKPSEKLDLFHHPENIQSLFSGSGGYLLQFKPKMPKHRSFVKYVIVFGPESKVCSLPTLLFLVAV